jgi:hypothetical protein
MRVKFMSIARCFGLGVVLLGWLGCQDLRPKYGVFSLRASGGETLYFKREVRGLNYDVLTLSVDKDHCKKPDPSRDYVFDDLGPHTIYYRIEGDVLTLYLTIPATPPRNFQSQIKVEQREMAPLEFAKVANNHKERGLTLLDVPLDEDLRCK